jgi:Tol biopolymer transport system component
MTLYTTSGPRLRVLSLDSGVVETVEAFDSENCCPIWAPEGRRLLFSGAAPRLLDLFLLDLDSNEKPRRLTESPHWHVANDWSGDGGRVVFTERRRDDQHDIYLLDLTETDPSPKPFATTGDNEAMARFSPDGRWIAFAKEVGGAPEIFVRPARARGSERLSGRSLAAEAGAHCGRAAETSSTTSQSTAPGCCRCR